METTRNVIVPKSTSTIELTKKLTENWALTSNFTTISSSISSNQTVFNIFTDEIVIPRKDKYLNEDNLNSEIETNQIQRMLNGNKNAYEDVVHNTSTNQNQHSSQSFDSISKSTSFLESLFGSQKSVSSSSSSYLLSRSFFHLFQTYCLKFIVLNYFIRIFC